MRLQTTPASRASIIGALDVFLVGGLKGERRA